jgi:hypothetical protein
MVQATKLRKIDRGEAISFANVIVTEIYETKKTKLLKDHGI